MSKKIILLLTCICIAGVFTANAQTVSFEVETDPIAFFSKGYNFNFGFSKPHWAIRLVPYKTELPEFLHGNKDFKQNMLGVAFDIDYFLNENNNGLFTGPVLIYSKDELINNVQQKINNNSLLLGLRLGYRIMPFSKHRKELNGFYFTPFVAPLYNFSSNQTFANQTVFEYKKFQLWAGIHLGWRINVLRKK